MEKLLNISFSPTGGTKKVADILVEGLKSGRQVEEIDLCDQQSDYSHLAISGEDIVLLSVPSYGGHVPCMAIPARNAAKKDPVVALRTEYLASQVF